MLYFISNCRNSPPHSICSKWCPFCKGIPITGHEGPRWMWMQGSTYSQPRHYKEVGWLALCSAVFTPQESPDTHFTGGYVEPRTSMDTKEWTKISTTLPPGIEPEVNNFFPTTFLRISRNTSMLLWLSWCLCSHPAHRQAPCHLSYRFLLPILYDT